MADKVSAVPKGVHALTPYLVVKNCAQAIEFYKKVFGAEEAMRMPGPDGTVGHAELRIGDSWLYLGDASPQFPPTQSSIVVYLEDCDGAFARALAAGAKVIQPLEDKFYGDRSGAVEDPFGQGWSISTHKEDLTPEQMAQRAPKG